jgi:hypothetical protein
VDPWGIPTYKNTVLRILKKASNCLEDHQFFAKFTWKLTGLSGIGTNQDPWLLTKKIQIGYLPSTVATSRPPYVSKLAYHIEICKPRTVAWFKACIAEILEQHSVLVPGSYSFSVSSTCRKVEKFKSLASRWQHARTYCLSSNLVPEAAKNKIINVSYQSTNINHHKTRRSTLNRQMPRLNQHLNWYFHLLE